MLPGRVLGGSGGGIPILPKSDGRRGLGDRCGLIWTQWGTVACRCHGGVGGSFNLGCPVRRVKKK